MNGLKQAVASFIAETRNERGMKQEDLARLVGVTRTSISNIEKSRQSLSLEMFCKIATALDYDPGKFLEQTISRIGRPKITKSEVPNDDMRKQLESIISKGGPR